MKATAPQYQKDMHAEYMRFWRVKNPRKPIWPKTPEEREFLLKALAKFREMKVKS